MSRFLTAPSAQSRLFDANFKNVVKSTDWISRLKREIELKSTAAAEMIVAMLHENYSAAATSHLYP